MNEVDTPKPAKPPTKKRPGSGWRPLRTWPVILLLVIMAVSYIPAFVMYGSPFAQILMMLGPAIAGLLMLVWWLLGSRADILEKLSGMFGIGAAFGLTVALLDRSMFGAPLIAVTIPMGGAALGLSALLLAKTRPPARTILMILATLVGFGFSTTLRGAGVWGGSGTMDLSWRFIPSVEDQLVADQLDPSELKGVSEFEVEQVDRWLTDPDWSAFRGPDRSGVVSGAGLDTEWQANPPKQLWSIPVGPGWSSFSVAGDLLFTQEQRGDQEMVICYAADTGEVLWTHGVESRFEDSIGGPGPRATPTIADSDLFVLGASGHLMRLDAKTGEPKWKSDLGKATDSKPPTWGYSSSPLIVDNAVIVHAGDMVSVGKVVAFDMKTGEKLWSVDSGTHSYSSAELWKIDGQDYIAMMSNRGFDLIDPNEKKVALSYEWVESTYRALQPRLLDDDSIIVCGASGTKRLKLQQDEDTWTVEEVWESRDLKSDFNDYVVHENHAYGFHNAIFTCINLEDGTKAWKGGRYGKGQVLLLADLNMLLVLSEEGDLVLVKANPESHQEVAKWNAIHGKTWNHPVLIGDRLYVRNSTEASCIELPTQQETVATQ